ncbi:unannotated protein [freshwater metagenome]|uniref:Unannotated protein n=1 Tax=freshwater metagenome TaxID=449393 RepID=A0A6J7CWG4_9ZZZZ
MAYRTGVRRGTVALWCAVLVGLACVALSATIAPQSYAAAPGRVELIVLRKPRLAAGERRALRQRAGADFVRSLRIPEAEIVSVPAGRAQAALGELRSDPTVSLAVVDAAIEPAATTTGDPSFGALWALVNPGGPGATFDADVDAPGAWAVATGKGVVVAVVDTGTESTHPDLRRQYAINPAESGNGRESNGIDDDGNGLVDDWRGWDFVDDDNNPATTLLGHGVHVLGTIVAANGNGIGISGIAPDARALPVRVIGDDNRGSWSVLLEATEAVASAGARVVNLSLGGPADPLLGQLFAQIAARHPSTLFVAAAGNSDLNLDIGENVYPCEAPASNVLCVGASTSNDTRALFSNYGSRSVDLFAPGSGILSTALGGRYDSLDGTSMAVPFASGAAALLFSKDPSLSGKQAREDLIAHVEVRSGMISVSGGRLDAATALHSPNAHLGHGRPTVRSARVLVSSRCTTRRPRCRRAASLRATGGNGASALTYSVTRRNRSGAVVAVTHRTVQLRRSTATTTRLPVRLPAGAYRISIRTSGVNGRSKAAVRSFTVRP